MSESRQNSLGGYWLQFFERVRERVPFNRRLRRMSIAVVIVLLTLFLCCSSLPDLRDAIASFFVGNGQPTQTTNSSSSFIFSPENIDGRGQAQAVVTVLPEETVVVSSITNATPGPKWPLPPAAMPTNCPAGPVVNDTHTVGSTPIWITVLADHVPVFTCPIHLRAVFHNGMAGPFTW